jgi:hypothetical protein
MTMTVTRVSSDTFNQDIGGAKRAADNGRSSSPVTATSRLMCF